MKQSLGWSAVFFAASEGYLNITRLLVNAGADVALRDKVCYMFYVSQSLHSLSLSLTHTFTHPHTEQHYGSATSCGSRQDKSIPFVNTSQTTKTNTPSNTD